MIWQPTNWWKVDELITIWKAVVILHNMIIKDEEGKPDLNEDYLFENTDVQVHVTPWPPLTFTRLTYVLKRMKNQGTMAQLKEDLVDHLWNVKGNDNEE